MSHKAPDRKAIVAWLRGLKLLEQQMAVCVLADWVLSAQDACARCDCIHIDVAFWVMHEVLMPGLRSLGYRCALVDERKERRDASLFIFPLVGTERVHMWLEELS